MVKHLKVTAEKVNSLEWCGICTDGYGRRGTFIHTDIKVAQINAVISLFQQIYGDSLKTGAVRISNTPG